MSWGIVDRKTNERGTFTISEKDGSFRVMGAGMIKPRYFPNHGEAELFAQDQLLILTLEVDLALAAS